MAHRQNKFLERFKMAFEDRFRPVAPRWGGGQTTANTAGLEADQTLRRDRKTRRGEKFELGDLRWEMSDLTVVVEYEFSAMSVHNLLKYWPYLRGELDKSPSQPIVLCHFSDWSSYASSRDLWKWLCRGIRQDSARKVEFYAHQFDHGGTNKELAKRGLANAMRWLEEGIRSGVWRRESCNHALELT